MLENTTLRRSTASETSETEFKVFYLIFEGDENLQTETFNSVEDFKVIYSGVHKPKDEYFGFCKETFCYNRFINHIQSMIPTLW
jgi:ssDNA-specific exonuclease RecJ